MSTASVTLYPSPLDGVNGDYLAVLKIAGDSIPLPPETRAVQYCNIVILDVSGSMGQYVQRVVQKILPQVFHSRGFGEDDEVNLILFESSTTVHKHKVKEFPTLPYRCRGGTNMGPVFPQLERLLKAQALGTFVRLLTVSDGDVMDVDKTCTASSSLMSKIESTMNLNISSTGVRLFTSTYANPDTRALSTVLQFNSTSDTPSLVDIAYPSGNIDKYCSNAAEVIELHYGAGQDQSYVALGGAVDELAAKSFVLGSRQDMGSDKALFKQHPWSQPSCALAVKSKTTLFWVNKAKFDALKPTQFTVSDTCSAPITVYSSALDNSTYEELIASRIEYYLMQMKLLRVVGTVESVKRLTEMSNYFISLEKHIYTQDAALIQDVSADSTELTSLKQRLAQLYKTVKSANSRLGQKLSEIVNMDKTTTFNSAQAASFLRSTGGAGAASRGLVRRAGTDLDFDTIVKDEVVKMAKNLPQLEAKMTPEIENSLKSSFVSLGTTLDGIRAVCGLATTTLQGQEIALNEIGTKESLLDTLTAFQILTYLNIIGVPVQSTIGDYPDPYRYNINVIFTGHYCSLSDLMTLHQVQEGDTSVQAQLYIPGDKTESGRIDNVVPLIENRHIYNFLMDFSPQILSLYSSIGMRRMMAHIWETPHATLSAALVKMMRVLVVEPTPLNVDIMEQIYLGLTTFNRLNPNRRINCELVKAAEYVRGFKPSTEPIAPTPSDDESLHYLSNDLPHLPQIQTTLTSLMFPLISMYKTKSIKVNSHINEISDKEMSAIMRSTYYNEVYMALRSEFRGKVNGDKIRLNSLHDLIGFNSGWVPQLSSMYEQDGPFDPVMAKEASSKGFFKSKTFKSALNRIQRLNILLAVPFFAQLFNAFDRRGNGNDDGETTALAARREAIEELRNDVPRLLGTPETYLALKKKEQVQHAKDRLRAHDGGETNHDDDYFDDDNDDGFDDGDGFYRRDVLSADQVVQYKTLVEEYQEETRGKYDEASNMAEMKWSSVFYDEIDFDEESFDISGATNNNDNNNSKSLMQLYAVLYAYSHSELDQRFPQGQWDMHDFGTASASASGGPAASPEHTAELQKQFKALTPRGTTAVDFPESISFAKSDYIQFITVQQLELYRRAYNAAVNNKIKLATAEVFVDLTKALLTASDLPTFVTLLSNGLQSNQYFAKFDTYQCPQLKPFWSALISKEKKNTSAATAATAAAAAATTTTTTAGDDADDVIPLRTEKLRIVILGRSADGTVVWNGGRILYDHDFGKAAQFFYVSDAKRGEWIEICKEYAEKRAKFDYRATDLPNRHSHHLSHPSYYGLGYESLVDYKKAVSSEVYKQYCKDHKDCCGLTPVTQKRQRLGRGRNNGKPGASAGKNREKK